MSTEPGDLAGLKAYPRARAGTYMPSVDPLVSIFRQAHADHLSAFHLTTDDSFPSWVAVKG